LSRVYYNWLRHNSLRLCTIFGLTICIVLAACGGDDPQPVSRIDPTFASIQAEVFTPTCAVSGCHDVSQREAGLCLAASDSYGDLVGVEPTTNSARMAGKLRIDPGNPENSFLLDKLRGPDFNEGHRMPYNGPYLSAEDIAVIETWIEDGALP
jgi:hypothetical protein